MPQIIRFFRPHLTTGPQGIAYEPLIAKDSVNSPAVGASLWDDCPLLVEQFDPAYGRLLDTNWFGTTPATNAVGGWTTTTATSGAVTLDATKGLKVDAGAVTQGQGVNFQLNRTQFTPTANKPIWMEGSLLFSALATNFKIQFLFGLAAAGTTLITSNAVGTDDKAAFDGVTTTGVIVSDCTASSTSGTSTGFTVPAGGAGTTLKLGLKLTTTACDFWVNGALVKTLSANIPTAALAPSLVVQANATVQPIVYIDWLRVFQIR